MSNSTCLKMHCHNIWYPPNRVVQVKLPVQVWWVRRDLRHRVSHHPPHPIPPCNSTTMFRTIQYSCARVPHQQQHPIPIQDPVPAPDVLPNAGATFFACLGYGCRDKRCRLRDRNWRMWPHQPSNRTLLLLHLHLLLCQVL